MPSLVGWRKAPVPTGLVAEQRASHKGFVLQMLLGELPFCGSLAIAGFRGLFPSLQQANAKWSADAGGKRWL